MIFEFSGIGDEEEIKTYEVKQILPGALNLMIITACEVRENKMRKIIQEAASEPGSSNYFATALACPSAGFRQVIYITNSPVNWSFKNLSDNSKTVIIFFQ